MAKTKDKLLMWQERLAHNEAAYDKELKKMDSRERLYRGETVENPEGEEHIHIRNICAEMVESQVSSAIPNPKVTARRKEDELKAKLIEDMIRNELNRLPFETLNDIMERTVPIQGGAGFLLEWDNTQRTALTVGELAVSSIHPKQMIPQDGVTSGIAEMDFIILKVPQTKEFIRKKYGMSVEDMAEHEPDIRGMGEQDNAADLVTQYIAYYRNETGGIGLYSWANDTELADMEDYQARRLRRCTKCGAVEPMDSEAMELPSVDGTPPYDTDDETVDELALDTIAVTTPDQRGRKAGARCLYCGANSWEETAEEYEELYSPVARSDGSVVGGVVPVVSNASGEVDANGMPVQSVDLVPTKIPYYKPDIYPIVLQKNVSLYGSFLGDSDIDKITPQQETTNRIESKLISKLFDFGSLVVLPPDASVTRDKGDMRVVRVQSPADAAQIKVLNMQGDVGQDMSYLQQVYEEARQMIGITDSFQGRADATATSGKAKEFAASQSAGRLESKRMMKEAAYADLFRAIFQFKLAYTDEPRPVTSTDIRGQAQYQEFNRYDFLKQDETGEWYWNDEFLFSCDTSAPLASNREAMWQETRMNLQTGAFGDPASMDTLILFWTKMELLHYPGAGDTKQYLIQQLQKLIEQQQAQAQLQMQMQAQQMQAGQPPATPAMRGGEAI